MLFLLLCCTSTPSIEKDNASSTTNKNTSQEFSNLDQGQKHPPLPADNPIWEWDAKTFVPDYGWYGEHSWMDVRMRVAGHLSAAGRDLARMYAMREEWIQAAKQYTYLRNILAKIPFAQEGTSKEINSLLLQAAKRDSELLLAIANNSVLPTTTGTIYPLRIQYFALAIRNQQGEDISLEAQNLQKQIEAAFAEYPELDIDSFTDFHSRHELRIRLFSAYLDALDPLSINEPWGYWTAEEIEKQRNALGFACAQLSLVSWNNIQTETPKTHPLLWPSYYRSQEQASLDASVEEFGALPTGDSLIDIASSPGPKGIGDLMKWGLQDKSHIQWLTQAAKDITESLPQDPQASISAYKKHVSYLEHAKHGSRFYNVKQLRNATVRQLARSKKYQEAHLVLEENFPLHNQDWACPNREGILRAIDGRLLALAHDASAEETLQHAISLGLEFLHNVDKAEKGLITTPKPPNPQQTPNHAPSQQKPNKQHPQFLPPHPPQKKR